MPDTHKATLQQANAAITQGDHEGFLVHCTEDTVWTFVGDQTLRGKQAVREWMATAYRETPVFELQRMVAEGDYLTAIGEITLKDKNGKATRHGYCDVWRFHGGKLAELQAFVVEAPLN